MKLHIPQTDPNPERRAEGITLHATHYEYDYNQIDGLAMVAQIPSSDHPSIGWGKEVAKNLLPALINMAHVGKQKDLMKEDHPSHRTLMDMLHAAHFYSMDEILTRVEAHIQDSLVSGRHALTPDEYEEIFQSLDVPDVHNTWSDDENFAWLRIAGPNPMVLKRCDVIPDNFPVSETHFEQALAAHGERLGPTSDSLAQALSDGRCFVCDYNMFEDFEEGDIPHGRKKYIRTPMALFATLGSDKTLLPIAIQCGQVSDESHPVFTPADGENWQMAKVCVNVADGNLHQAAIHLAHTHLVTEPVIIAIRRNLAANHPIQHLLRPHHEGTFYINDAANRRLLAEGGGVDSLLVGTLKQSRAAAAAATQDWKLNESFVPSALKARGVDDTSAFPSFPYRDDALLVWGAISDWVSAYLSIFYASDDDVRMDSELQAFVTELEAQDGGRLSGVREPGATHPVATFGYLVELVTALIFIPSAQHAAVNFPQLEVMAFCPNLPLAAYQPPPGEGDGSQTLLNTLPTLDMAEFQMLLGRLLGGTRYTQLGQYPHHLGHSFDHHPQVKAALKEFQSALASIEETIVERNRDRYRVYEYLQPSLIPQSINI